VSAQGGSRKAAQASRSGRKAAHRLAGIISSFATQGLRETARKFGFSQLLGQDVETFLGALVDLIAPAGAELEDAVTRQTTAITLSDLFEKIGVGENGFERLERLGAEDMKEVLERFTANYIILRLINVLAGKLEESFPTDRVVEIEENIRDYVTETVKLDLSEFGDLHSFDWDGAQGKRLIDRIFMEGYEIIEASL
jgi:hypothetical protein